VTKLLQILGVFNLEVFENGRLISQESSHNLVVNSGLTAIADLLRGITTGREIADIGFGTNGTPTVATTTALTDPYLKPFTLISQPSPGRLEIDWSLELTEANGMDIREFGLLSANGTLIARKNRDLLQKTSALTLQGKWIILIKAVR
jgi:hypothetical protein